VAPLLAARAVRRRRRRVGIAVARKMRQRSAA
jgi:hypothetical protein